MITYHCEALYDIQKELTPLLTAHYEEIAMYRDKIPLEPDWDFYFSLDANGGLHISTVRDEDNKLVGYSINILRNHPHYESTLYAMNDIVYLEPKYRNAKIGLELFSFVEEKLKELGVKVVTVHMKTKAPFDNLCKGLGFDYAERLYTKYIGD